MVKHSGDNSNSVMIDTIGDQSSVTINQGLLPNQYYTVFQVDENSGIEEIPSRDVTKRAIYGFIAIGIAALALFSDILSVSSYFGISKIQATIPIVVISIVIAAVNAKQLNLFFLPISATKEVFSWGRFARRSIDGKYVVYHKTASCIYPNCRGIVTIVPAPPREKHNHSIVGICSIGEKRHTYTVDPNGIGYPHSFDWSPPEEKSK